jgi:hypothetical protein
MDACWGEGLGGPEFGSREKTALVERVENSVAVRVTRIT